MEEAEEVIGSDPLEISAETVSGEERLVSLGPTKSGRILVVVSTMRRDLIRVVTAFPANRRLVDLYFLHSGS